MIMLYLASEILRPALRGPESFRLKQALIFSISLESNS